MMRARGIATIVLIAALVGCAAIPETPDVPRETHTPSPTPDKVLLTWQGQTDAGCSTIRVTMSRQLVVGLCGEIGSDLATIRQEDSLIFLDTMEKQLAPISDDQSADHMVFAGTGSGSSEAWGRALVAWARWTFAENYSGHACAACRTILSWQAGEDAYNPETCGHVTVLDFGVAYAETGPCDGSKWTLVDRAVLSTEQWETIDGWLATYQTYNDGVTIFNGKGTEPLSDQTFDDIDGWAKAVYEGIAAH